MSKGGGFCLALVVDGGGFGMSWSHPGELGCCCHVEEVPAALLAERAYLIGG